MTANPKTGRYLSTSVSRPRVLFPQTTCQVVSVSSCRLVYPTCSRSLKSVLRNYNATLGLFPLEYVLVGACSDKEPAHYVLCVRGVTTADSVKIGLAGMILFHKSRSLHPSSRTATLEITLSWNDCERKQGEDGDKAIHDLGRSNQIWPQKKPNDSLLPKPLIRPYE